MRFGAVHSAVPDGIDDLAVKKRLRLSFMALGGYPVGAIDLDHRHVRDAHGVTWTFLAWTTTSDLSDPERGFVWITIEHDTTSSRRHTVHLCAADYTEAWYEKFVRAFLAHPAFREAFLDKPDVPHAATVIMTSAGPAVVDAAIADALERLNQVGAITQFSCEGDEDSGAYITLSAGKFPHELMAAWENAGFDVSSQSVRPNPPVGLWNVAALAWRQSLTDWLDGTLDATGARYRITGPRPSSLPALPSVPRDLQKNIRRLVQLGHRATFRDYAALRSGRDAFSRLSLDALASHVPADVVALVIEERLDDKSTASALRWVLRGLPAAMALRKVRTDAEIAHNAHPSH